MGVLLTGPSANKTHVEVYEKRNSIVEAPTILQIKLELQVASNLE